MLIWRDYMKVWLVPKKLIKRSYAAEKYQMKKTLKLPQKKFLLFTGIGLFLLFIFSPIYMPVLLSETGKYLITDEPIKTADAIVMLSGSIPERALEAAELYKQGLAPKIFLTKMKRSEAHRYMEEVLLIDVPDDDEVNLKILRKLGVKEEAIYVAAEEINSTEDEAQVLKPLFKEQGIQNILLVTSKSHTKRGEKIFRWVLEVKFRLPRYHPDMIPLTALYGGETEKMPDR